MSERTDICKQCVFFKPDWLAEEKLRNGTFASTLPYLVGGQCRRRAAQVGMMIWPTVNGSDWCGEFEGATRE